MVLILMFDYELKLQILGRDIKSVGYNGYELIGAGYAFDWKNDDKFASFILGFL